MNISGSSIINNIYRLATRVNQLLSQLPTSADKIIYVSPRGNDTNDGLSWGTAKLTLAGGVAALTGSGVIQLGAGIISTGGNIDLSGRTSVTIQGIGGVSAGAAPATQVIHTGTGTSIINLQNSLGCRLREFQLLYSNAGFTGHCIDLRNVAGSDTAVWDIADMYIGGSGVSGAASAIAVDKAIDGSIQRCNIVGNAVGILGRSGAGTYANGILVDGCRFGPNTTRHISNIGQGWTIEGCVFEPLASGAAGAVINDAAILAAGVCIGTGNWFGDVTAGAGGTQISLGGTGIAIRDSFIGINTNATAVEIQANSRSVIVEGNRIEGGNAGDTGISIGAGTTMYEAHNNDISNVATPLVSTNTTSSIIRPLADSAKSFTFQNRVGGDILWINTVNGRVAISTATAPLAVLDVGGTVKMPYRSSAINVSLGLTDRFVGVDATGAARTATLPTAAGFPGIPFTIWKLDNSVNTVTVNTTGGQTINGAATSVLALQYDAVTVVSDGANWLIQP